MSETVADNWYYRRGHETVGPIAFDQLRRLAQGGEITPEALIRTDDETGWRVASSIESLWNTERSLSPPQRTPPSGENIADWVDDSPSTTAATENGWYFSDSANARIGPLTEEEFFDAMITGRVKAKTCVWHTVFTQGNWVLPRDIEDAAFRSRWQAFRSERESAAPKQEHPIPATAATTPPKEKGEADSWFYRDENASIGPLTEDELFEAVRGGHANSLTLVLHDVTTGGVWTRLEFVDDQKFKARLHPYLHGRGSRVPTRPDPRQADRPDVPPDTTRKPTVGDLPKRTRESSDVGDFRPRRYPLLRVFSTSCGISGAISLVFSGLFLFGSIAAQDSSIFVVGLICAGSGITTLAIASATDAYIDFLGDTQRSTYLLQRLVKKLTKEQ